MISVIVCSRDDARFKSVAEMYARLLSNQPHEIIRIADARSMCEGYNRGVAQSRGEQLIFSHDDIDIVNENLDPLNEHLKEFDVIGVVGTNKMIAGYWGAAGPNHVFGQIAEPRGDGFRVLVFSVPSRVVSGIVAMDGMFLATRRNIFEKIRFDETTFDGFHCYDIDFTFSAHLAGFRLAVCNDIHIIHESAGTYDATWERYSQRFEEKHRKNLVDASRGRAAVKPIHAETRADVARVMRSICDAAR